jgi:hypothetical protein
VFIWRAQSRGAAAVAQRRFALPVAGFCRAAAALKIFGIGACLIPAVLIFSGEIFAKCP